jgi:hypothetical protein
MGSRLPLMAASKKGMSALQLSRMLGVTYKSAWFLCHRIREAMVPINPSPIGGESKIVESDESIFGGKAKNRAYAKKEPKKHTIMTLVERDGESRSFHVANVRHPLILTLSKETQAPPAPQMRARLLKQAPGLQALSRFPRLRSDLFEVHLVGLKEHTGGWALRLVEQVRSERLCRIA